MVDINCVGQQYNQTPNTAAHVRAIPNGDILVALRDRNLSFVM